MNNPSIGAIKSIGKIEVKKYYPIPGRKDFFKYVVLENGKIAKGFQGNNAERREMFFNQKEDANRVAKAKRALLKKYK